MMTQAVRCLGESRREWSAAMEAEFAIAVIEGKPLTFAAGCLAAAWRDMLSREDGRFTLTSHAVALGLMVPMAAIQIGCALFGFPFLYPGTEGLAGALLLGGDHLDLVRDFYQAAVPPLGLLLIALGLGHLCIAWAMLDCDWARVRRIGTFTLAVATTLILFMSALFLDSSRALLQVGVLTIELAIVWLLARWSARLSEAVVTEHPG
jgi:hypothetical protein